MRLQTLITGAIKRIAPRAEIHAGAETASSARDYYHPGIVVGIRYIESWLRGNGCVPLFNLMEDAATAEISRAQLWQWLRHGATLDSGRTVDAALVKAVIAEEVLKIRVDFGAAENRLDEAVALFETVATAPDFAEFLTLPAYEKITTMAAGC